MKFMKTLGDWLKKYNHRIVILIGLIVFFVLIYFKMLEKTHVEEVSYFIFFATALLAWIAYSEFQRSNMLSKNEFLLFISNRWGSKEVILAREVIHDLFVKYYRDEESETKGDFKCSVCMVAKDLCAMSHKRISKDAHYIYVLNLLDFLEMVSYFNVRGDLEIDDVDNACGHNFIFYVEKKKKIILQRKNHRKSQYKNIRFLYDALKERNK